MSGEIEEPRAISYQLGIQWPDATITWGEPADQAGSAKAAGWYEQELEAVLEFWYRVVERAHVPVDGLRPPFFVRREVIQAYGPVH